MSSMLGMMAMSLPSTSTTRITAIGDSITAIACQHWNLSMTYSAQLQRMLGPAFNITNAGNSGKTMLKHGRCPDPPAYPPADWCGGDCSYWHTDTYAAAMASEPDLVTILLGTNDAIGCNWDSSPWGTQGMYNDSYWVDYADLIATLKALPSKPAVWALVPPPLFPYDVDQYGPAAFAFNMTPGALNTEIPQKLPAFARAHGADNVVDLFALLGGHNATLLNTTHGGDTTCDGIHPQDASLTKIATLLKEQVLAWVSQK